MKTTTSKDKKKKKWRGFGWKPTTLRFREKWHKKGIEERMKEEEKAAFKEDCSRGKLRISSYGGNLGFRMASRFGSDGQKEPFLV